MTDSNLEARYRTYLACLNRQDWSGLEQYISENVRYNGQVLSFNIYKNMIAQNFVDIPDLKFAIDLLIVDRDHVASRLLFDCTPTGNFLGVPVNGRKVKFAENVFYRFTSGRIGEIWSVIDKAAIEAQVDGEQ